MAITPKQKAVFDYIKKYLDENGVSPTFDEIALRFNYRSKGTVYKHIKALRYNGLIRQEWNRPRSMKVSRPGAANRSYLPIKGEWVDKKIIWTKPPYELINAPSGLTRNNRSFLIRMRNNAFQALIRKLFKHIHKFRQVQNLSEILNKQSAHRSSLEVSRR